MPTTTTHLVDRAIEAAVLVFEESLFVTLERVDGASSMEGDTVHTMIAFHGAHEATLHLRLPWSLAEEITADFLGEGEPEEGLVLDACGEAANMVAGRLVKALSPEARRYTLEIPTVMVEEDAPIDEATCALTTGMQPVHLWLEGPAAPAARN
jgi:CheY-specific phosphatase CheX